MSSLSERTAVSEQRADLYEVVDRIASKLLDEADGKPATVKFQRLCAKAGVKSATMYNEGIHYQLDEKPGIEYEFGAGKVEIRPGKWKEHRQNYGRFKG